MDSLEAREHLEMVDRILTEAEGRSLRPIPGLIIVWGIAAAAINVGQQMYVSHVGGRTGAWIADGALIIGVLYSIGLCITFARCHSSERMTHAEHSAGRMIGAVWFTVIVAAFAQPHVFAGWGGGAVWTVGAAIMMLGLGFSGDKRGLAGGLILLASLLAANYAFAQTPGYALAAGFIFGYAIPGILYLSQPPFEHA
jgi:hypothetical protein